MRPVAPPPVAPWPENVVGVLALAEEGADEGSGVLGVFGAMAPDPLPPPEDPLQ